MLDSVLCALHLTSTFGFRKRCVTRGFFQIHNDSSCSSLCFDHNALHVIIHTRFTIPSMYIMKKKKKEKKILSRLLCDKRRSYLYLIFDNETLASHRTAHSHTPCVLHPEFRSTMADPDWHSDFPLDDGFYDFPAHASDPLPPAAQTPTPATPVPLAPDSPDYGPPPSSPGSDGSRASQVSLSSYAQAFQDALGQDLAYPGSPTRRAPPKDDPRTRELSSLYDLDLLVSRPTQYAAENIGVLRSKWQAKFQQDSNGGWYYVEYVPAWTDPDWDERFTYIQGAQTASDPVTAQYAKPGLLQTQRPALRPSDARYNPTDAAKRFGFYPWQRKVAGNDDPDGHSGVTPWAAAFPNIPLRHPQITARRMGLQATVNINDLNAERLRWEAECALQNIEPTDEGFRKALISVAHDGTDPENASMADSLLQLLNMVIQSDERDEYQRMLYGGSTTNEVRAPGREHLGSQVVDKITKTFFAAC